MSGKNLDTIDGAFKSFDLLLTDLTRWMPTVSSEQDTRLKIIDPIFNKVLGWDLANIRTEESTGDGFVDYSFSIENRARMIVEAKKDALTLNTTNRTAGRAYMLNGAVLSKKPQPRNGILQAIHYCGSKNAELACVTNGTEWIIFRGSRLGDGIDTLNGMAYIFSSIESIHKNFTLFFDLLSHFQIVKNTFRAHFQEAEGQPIRSKSFNKTLFPIDNYHLLKRTTLSQDIDRGMTKFFRQISGDEDPEMLAKCFVTTKESQIADEKLIRITDEISTKIRDLDTNEANALTQVIIRVKETQRNEFALIVGTKGAGKSTFIDRFFIHVLPESLRSSCIVIRLNVGDSPGDCNNVVTWLNQHLLNKLENTVFGKNGPTYEELQGMYFDEYQRWKRGPHKFLYESDKIEFKNRFGEHIDNRREERPDDYIRYMIRHIVCSRRKVPCLVFDNTDHFSIEFQEKVFQFARSIYENEVCFVIIPITDKTSWQLSQQGALQSFDNEAFFLPTPQPRVVIEQRIKFLEEKLRNSKKEKGTNYLFGKNISLTLNDLQGFVSCLQKVFLETGIVSKWIGNLANNDIRRCLKLSRSIVSSPYLRVHELLKTYVSRDSYTISEFDIKRSILRYGYNIYPSGQHEFIQNIYVLNTEVDSTPLLGLRILRLLRDAKHHDAGGLEDYVTIDQILDYFHAINIDRQAIHLCLDVLLKTGLCHSHDPTIRDIAKAKKIQLSLSGLQHLLWGSYDETYIGTMLKVTPIGSEIVYNTLQSYKHYEKYKRWQSEVCTFLQYLLNEDTLYTLEIDHPAYEGQLKLKKTLRKRIEKIEKK